MDHHPVGVVGEGKELAPIALRELFCAFSPFDRAGERRGIGCGLRSRLVRGVRAETCGEHDQGTGEHDHQREQWSDLAALPRVRHAAASLDWAVKGEVVARVA